VVVFKLILLNLAPTLLALVKVLAAILELTPPPLKYLTVKAVLEGEIP
jgi:hypothetical protein